VVAVSACFIDFFKSTNTPACLSAKAEIPIKLLQRLIMMLNLRLPSGRKLEMTNVISFIELIVGEETTDVQKNFESRRLWNCHFPK
jgi:hypothetical protein